MSRDRPLVRWITNIPTPYRNHRYRVAGRVFPGHGLDFEVWYMAWSEHDRHWRFDDADLDHPHRVWSGVHPVVRGTDLHVNPALVAAARRHPADVTIVAGWASLTTLALARLLPHGRTLHLLESESNDASVSQSGSVFDRARRMAVRAAQGYVVPGPTARRLLERIDPAAAGKPVLELPNIVDEAAFAAARIDPAGRDAARRRLGLPSGGEGRQVWLCAARLEPFKGLDLLIPHVAALPVTLVVAGTGSQREALERQARSAGADVRFVGQQDDAAMVGLYAVADVFVLPSRRDPNPLTPIEALAAGVPVAVSTRAGNVHEVVADGAGWALDIDDDAAFAGVLAEVAASSPAARAERAAAARARHAARFASEPAMERFAAGLRALVGHAGDTGRPEGSAP